MGVKVNNITGHHLTLLGDSILCKLNGGSDNWWLVLSSPLWYWHLLSGIEPGSLVNCIHIRFLNMVLTSEHIFVSHVWLPQRVFMNRLRTGCSKYRYIYRIQYDVASCILGIKQVLVEMLIWVTIATDAIFKFLAVTTPLAMEFHKRFDR
jgi:hypothetical protein